MTTATPQPDLLSVLRRRRELARAMLHLATRQQELISQQQFSELLQLIAQKQRVLEQLTELGQSFGGIVEHWRSVRDRLPQELRQQCQEAIDDSEHLLAQIMDLEQQGTAVMTRHRDETQKRLQEAGHAVEARSASGTSLQTPQPAFLDVSR